MSSILMYGDVEGQGWFSSNSSLQTKNIENKDTNQKKDNSPEPRVSVPSPFARFELVQKAFHNFAELGGSADTRDRNLVSQVLDLMELFYEAPENLSYEKWTARECINELTSSPNHGHNLLGNALEQYSVQESYGFQEQDVEIYIIKYNGEIVGCTSPTSIFMPTPQHEDFKGITIEGSREMFGPAMMLFARDENFIEYVYYTAFQFAKYDFAPMQSFINYLTKQKDLIKQKHPNLYKRISTFPQLADNPDMESLYSGKSGIRLLDYLLYQRRKEDVTTLLQTSSDFNLIGSKPDVPIPLVLTNNCTYPSLCYTSKVEKWSQKKHGIDYSKTLNQRERPNMPLPGTSIMYEWICENDLLSDIIIQLPYKLDTEHYFSGITSNNDNDCSFLPPLKPKFFDYFSADYLTQRDGDKKHYEVEIKKNRNNDVEQVDVYLSLSIGKYGSDRSESRPITLHKTYYVADTPEEALNGASGLSTKHPDRAVGYIVECPLALSIFPFYKLPDNNYYRIQLAKAHSFNNFNVTIIPYQLDSISKDKLLEWETDAFRRTDSTTYYSLKGNLDYFAIQFSDGAYRSHYAVVIPIWPKQHNGAKELKFAIDFGTTNSHIAIKDGNDYKNFALNQSMVTTISKDNTNDMNSELMKVMLRQEFLPYTLGSLYKFPMRTVMLKSNTLDLDMVTPRCLQHSNIPFIYGKEDYNSSINEIVPNLKWADKDSKDKGGKLAAAFIEETVFLCRAYALENSADLKKCKLVWTYPLSMSEFDIDKLKEKWATFYKRYFNPNYDSETDSGYVKSMTESIAPLLFYADDGKANSGSLELSVDIGGGTCDIVIRDGANSRPDEKCNIKINSFHFAADAIFAAGRAKENIMVQKYLNSFVQFLNANNVDKKIVEMLREVCSGQQSASEASSMLFSLESLPALDKKDAEDKSYNIKLSKDHEFRIVFIYFYASIIYYLAKLLESEGYESPRTIYFSGTGSKLLNIIGTKETLKSLTTKMIEGFSNFKYGDDRVNIVIESKEPKQLTAKGALFKENDRGHDIYKNFENVGDVEKNSVYYSLTEKKNLTYGDIEDDSIINEVVASVEAFNNSFMQLSEDINFVNNYGCSQESIDNLAENMNKRLKENLRGAIIDSKDPTSKITPKTPFHDSLFFYPIKKIINDILVK